MLLNPSRANDTARSYDSGTIQYARLHEICGGVVGGIAGWCHCGGATNDDPVSPLEMARDQQGSTATGHPTPWHNVTR
jgi:hypothetical protein